MSPTAIFLIGMVWGIFLGAVMVVGYAMYGAAKLNARTREAERVMDNLRRSN